MTLRCFCIAWTLVAGISGVVLAQQDWPMFLHDRQHTGLSPFLTSINPGSVKWKSPDISGVVSSPAIGADGTIYVGSLDKNLYAVKPDDGKKKWAFPTNGFVYSTPSIATDGTIYVGSDDKHLYAVNPNGTKKWAFLTNEAVRSSPAIGTDGTIYFGSDDKNLYALNPNGTQEWAFPTNGAVESSPAVGTDGTIYVGSDDGNLYAVTPDGFPSWNFEIGTHVRSSPAIDVNGNIWVGSMGTNNNFIYAIRPNGSLKSKFKTPFPVQGSPAVAADGTIYIGTDGGKVYALNADGSLKWKFKTEGSIVGSPAIGKLGRVYIGSADGNLYAIGPKGPLAWKFFAEGPLATSPAIAKDRFNVPAGTVYVSADSLYALGLPNDFLTFKERASPGSEEGAEAYYQAVDKDGLRKTLGDWWEKNGFDRVTGTSKAEARAAYLNDNDLGFGRDMHCLRNGSNIACYVTNYGDHDQRIKNADLALEADKAKAIATVAMEYRPIEGQVKPIVKFFVYNGGKSGNGQGERLPSANLDGYGEKFVPQLCLECHGGDYSPAKVDTPTPDEVDMGSSFREFDLASFRYPHLLSRDNQERAFKRLNNIVLKTGPAPAIIELINGWYANNSVTQNSDFVPEGWRTNSNIEHLYQTVVAKSCRTCHVAQGLSFSAYSQFLAFRPTIKSYVCGTNPSLKDGKEMPHALITFKNFWFSKPSRPSILATFEEKDWPAFGVLGTSTGHTGEPPAGACQ